MPSFPLVGRRPSKLRRRKPEREEEGEKAARHGQAGTPPTASTTSTDSKRNGGPKSDGKDNGASSPKRGLLHSLLRRARGRQSPPGPTSASAPDSVSGSVSGSAGGANGGGGGARGRQTPSSLGRGAGGSVESGAQSRDQGPKKLAKGASSPSPSSTGTSKHRNSSIPTRRSPPVNANKPLPFPPPSEREDANGPSSEQTPVLKLNRIMATLAEDEIEKLFSGAPQYFARSEGHFTGAPHPSVAFPWDEALEIRDLCDYVQIEDPAWGPVTAWPHVTRGASGRDSAAPNTGGEKKRKKAHFYPRCRERPNMLSMQGLEKGTMGYQAALEISVADALQEEQYGFDSVGSKAKVVVEQRQKMMTSKEGLRRLEEAAILDQLIKNGERYRSDRIHKNISSTLYNELFLGILHPPTRVVDHRDPYSLSVQIQALLKILATPNVWIDFSHVEWRIRLGQILWGSFEGDEVETDIDVEDAETNDERKEERYWLLLQILLACELLVRLDAITEGDELGLESIKPGEIHRFEKDATLSVKWSMHLARVWLENIQIMETEVDPGHSGTARHHLGGWLSSLTGKMTLHGHGYHHKDKVSVYTIQGRYPQRQVDGLAHFAKKLRWPEADTYASRVSENVEKALEATPIHTPIDDTPMTMETKRSSYFGGGRVEADVQRYPSRRRKISAALHPSGWLSKSYISGLMLPGEGLNHLIMSTLLENDKDAMDKLGPMANLCGGFVYGGKSFWSTVCVVGRVLAAGKGSSECMGWVSSDVVPQGLEDGWVNIDVREIIEDTKNTGKKARLWGKTHIERDSAVLGDADPASVLPADFIIPIENNYIEPPPAVKVELKALNLFAPVDSVHTTPTEETPGTPFTAASKAPDIHTYPSSLTFSVSQAGKFDQEYNFALSKDVYFVTAHPCAPSAYVKIIKSPSSPTIQQVDVSGAGEGSSSGASKTPSPSPSPNSSPCSLKSHPLHRYFTYKIVHLSELLSKPADATLEDILQEKPDTAGAHRRRPSLTPALSADGKPRVLVVDCITGLTPPPQSACDAPLSPSSPIAERNEDRFGAAAAAAAAMKQTEGNLHLESRRRQFGSDLEVLVRALCAEKGWNALVSRRRRGCLACAIREAGALGWRMVIRVV